MDTNYTVLQMCELRQGLVGPQVTGFGVWGDNTEKGRNDYFARGA